MADQSSPPQDQQSTGWTSWIASSVYSAASYSLNAAASTASYMYGGEGSYAVVDPDAAGEVAGKEGDSVAVMGSTAHGGRDRASLAQLAKGYIGLDISGITLPVWVFEPVTVLQRQVEALDYADLIINAANEDNSTFRMAHICAFLVSNFSESHLHRKGKPFNPLLGETFE